MESDSVLYNGKSVLKAHFRVFIYGNKGEKKLMNSWDEYQSHIQSGLWFDSLEALEDKVIRKKIEKKKTIFNSGTFEVSGAPLLNDDSLIAT